MKKLIVLITIVLLLYTVPQIQAQLIKIQSEDFEAYDANIQKVVGTVGDDSTNWKTAYDNYVVIDYAGIYTYDADISTTIDLTDQYHKLTIFTADMEKSVSNGAHATDNITIGATGTYLVRYDICCEVAAGAKDFAFDVFEIAAAASGTAITGITEATPGVVTTSENHGLEDGDKIKITGVVGMVMVNDKLFTVANKTDKTFELTDDEGIDVNTAGVAWSSGGTVHVATQLYITHAHSEASNQDIARTTAAGGYVLLTKDNVVEMYVKNITDATNILIIDGQFRIERKK